MIKLIDNSTVLPDILLSEKNDDPFLCRITSLYHVYGFERSFVDFWVETDERGKEVSLISRLDSQFTLYLTNKSNTDEISEFIYAVGAAGVICDIDLAPQIIYPIRENGSILKFTGTADFLEELVKTEIPDLKDIFRLLNKTEGSGRLEDFESFYTDLAHKKLNNRARVYAVIRNDRPVSCAMTVAESEHAAIIGATATDREYRGNGFASALINRLCGELIAENKKIYVYTQKGKIIEFYKKLGFSMYGGWSEFRLE